MTHITENGWTLHYTIGRELAAAVEPGDTVHLPTGHGARIVLSGRAPQRINDCGGVIVNDPNSEITGERELRPSALGMVWISAADGWSELPRAARQSPPRYCADAVQQQIERDRRRHRISKKEEQLIHALLKGRSA
ncbi:hypothetical protein [Sphingobium estronivorans]|uniref:hypothetical protein n=1 Tax=Sphingobium estronivorans TaxID=1577690 RepID=UPI001239D920|nr:hypothetical protein [Sphingobium estronivorans]